MYWIDIISYLSPNFILKPQSITLTAPNGVGKTTSIMRFIAQIQQIADFDRIFIVVPSHEIANKVVNLLENFGANRIIHYVGIEKVCINKQLLNKMKNLNLSVSLACHYCEYNIYNVFQVFDHTKQLVFAYKYVENQFKNNKKTINPIREKYFDFKRGNLVCIQPLIKKLTIYPQIDAKLKKCTIFIVPYALFSSKAIILSWKKFFKRQRAVRKYLVVFDECDQIIYQGFSYKISKPNFTNFDYDILKNKSTKRYNLLKYVSFYEKLYDVLYRTAEGYIYNDDCVKIVTDLFKTYFKIIKKVQDLAYEIAKEAFESNSRTFIVSSISEVYSIEYFTETMANTIEIVNDDIIIQDLDYAYKILYETSFPFRYFWKISTTATFPQAEIFYQSKLIERGKECIEHVETIDIYPENVSIFTFSLFPELFNEIILYSRNELIEQKLEDIVKLIRKSISLYRQITNSEPNGLILFTGNKTQFNVLKDTFSNIIHEDYDGLFNILYKNIKIYITYCASKYARGIDFDQLDISIVISPLIRPPRQETFLDTLDIARATAETIQSLFRVVRSLKPNKMKLIGIESNLLFKKTYLISFPTWFIKLLNNLISEGKIFKLHL